MKSPDEKSARPGKVRVRTVRTVRTVFRHPATSRDIFKRLSFGKLHVPAVAMPQTFRASPPSRFSAIRKEQAKPIRGQMPWATGHVLILGHRKVCIVTLSSENTSNSVAERGQRADQGKKVEQTADFVPWTHVTNVRNSSDKII